MISINYKTKDNHINFMKISGHADYADEGFDIVCASVSSIAITTVNAIVRYDENAIIYRDLDGLLEIAIVKYSEFTDILMNNMVNMLEELEKQYKDYIKIR